MVHLTLWPYGWTFKFWHTFCVKCEYFMSKESNIMKYTTFCGGKNKDCAKIAVSILIDEISKIQSLAGSSMSIVYMGWVLFKD
jgi:hypothetical protein